MAIELFEGLQRIKLKGRAAAIVLKPLTIESKKLDATPVIKERREMMLFTRKN